MSTQGNEKQGLAEQLGRIREYLTAFKSSSEVNQNPSKDNNVVQQHALRRDVNLAEVFAYVEAGETNYVQAWDDIHVILSRPGEDHQILIEALDERLIDNTEYNQLRVGLNNFNEILRVKYPHKQEDLTELAAKQQGLPYQKRKVSNEKYIPFEFYTPDVTVG
ncbi:MAG: hypothetical protein WBK77_07855 [Alphaproteobacteria bacterium]